MKTYRVNVKGTMAFTDTFYMTANPELENVEENAKAYAASEWIDASVEVTLIEEVERKPIFAAELPRMIPRI